MLRQARDGFRADLHSIDMAYEPHTVYALCGVSDDFRGFVFDEAHNLEPVECDSWSSPSVNRDINCAADVVDFAQAQIRYVQVKSPLATGRMLTIAALGPNGVAQTRVPLLLDHERGRAA